MGATEEQMVMLDAANVDHVSWILIIYSVAFLLYLCRLPVCGLGLGHLLTILLVANILIHIFVVNSAEKSIKLDSESATNGHANGHLVRDVEEFELGGLTDDEETDEEGRLLKEQKGSN
jgi:hypothetical protein